MTTIPIKYLSTGMIVVLSDFQLTQPFSHTLVEKVVPRASGPEDTARFIDYHMRRPYILNGTLREETWMVTRMLYKHEATDANWCESDHHTYVIVACNSRVCLDCEHRTHEPETRKLVQSRDRYQWRCYNVLCRKWHTMEDGCSKVLDK